MVSYGIGCLALLLLAYGMVLSVRAAKRNPKAAGALLAVAMLFGANWVMPPPRPETEDQDNEREDEDGEPD